MPVELSFPVETLTGFLLVLARMGGALSFVPLPGLRRAPQAARAALAAGFAVALFPRWPAPPSAGLEAGRLAVWVAAEAAIGLAIGVAAAIVLEAFAVAAQLAGLQAGYAYASTVDPFSEADSGVLLIFAQLASGLLFFALGLDREILRLFARSLETVPPGAYVFSAGSAKPVIALGGELLATGARLALPVVALLILLDVALALLGRLNQQLQLLSLAFPAKMLAALLILGWTAALLPRVLLEFGGHGWAVMRRLLGL